MLPSGYSFRTARPLMDTFDSDYPKAVVPYFTHKLQFCRVLFGCMAALLSFVSLFCVISDRLSSLPQDALLQNLDLLDSFLNLLTTVLLSFLFRNPNALFGFRRPSQRYRLAVYTVALCSTLPSPLLHILSIILTLSSQDRRLAPPLGFHYPILMSHALIITFIYWSVNHFLLRVDDDDGRYEPILALSANISNLPSESSPLLLPRYSDTPRDGGSTSSTSHFPGQPYLVPPGHLDMAYCRQPVLGTPAHRRVEDRIALSAGAAQTSASFSNSSASDASETTALTSSNENRIARLQCTTVALFDYMPQSQAGPHSWPSLALVVVVLGSMSALVLISFCVLAYESRKASPKVQ
jgi:hypothetical protein